VSLTDVAVTVTVSIAARLDGGLYVAPVDVTLDRVPHDDAEHVGLPHVTPEESFAGAFVTVAASDTC
jgi:hypothetical protein